ncbi:hypothetical protein C8Q79DRAFT_939464 [Trametes meyenii]|nr:hypothetical protein C8Q79DRAFT_939464 [Trametes meyenii]
MSFVNAKLRSQAVETPRSRADTAHSGPNVENLDNLKRTRPASPASSPESDSDYDSESGPKDDSEGDPPPAKRCKTECNVASDHPPPLCYTPSPDFWYPDGNVIVVVEDIGFRLLASRLSQHCAFFASLFEQEQLHPASAIPEQGQVAGNTPTPSHESAKMFTVTAVSAHQFTFLLQILELPFESPFRGASHDVAVAVYHASQALGCLPAQTIALRRIEALWHSHSPPGLTEQLCQTYADAVNAIALARNHGIPSILKRAFYELLRSVEFWEEVERGGYSTIDLSHKDFLHLYAARVALGKSWRTLCHTPPPTVKKAKKCRCVIKGDAETRLHAWRGMFSEDMLDVADPIMQTLRFAEEFVPPGSGWCDKCLRERQNRWTQARGKWWRELDGWLELADKGPDNTDPPLLGLLLPR